MPAPKPVDGFPDAAQKGMTMEDAPMITAEYCRTMARYNRWQNASLYTAADGLDDAARRADRGAFFGSIHRTLAHLVWADAIWMSRFDGGEKLSGGIPDSTEHFPDYIDLRDARTKMDIRISTWADALDKADVDGDFSWYSGVLKADVTKPRALCIAHMFNHQTHHRGQVHAMLTAAGAMPEATDLFVMPDA